MKILSVVIVTFNSDKLICDCLESIFKYNDIGDKLEIIIVDNASENVDNIFHRISIQFGNSIKLVKNDNNIGYGGGNNIGVNFVSSPYFIVMNPDVQLVEPVFSKIVSEFNNYNNIALLGVKFKDGSNNVYFKPEKTNILNVLFGKQMISLGLYRNNQIFFSGSFMAFKKSSFVKVGMFDKNIFLYHEEADVINRLLSSGEDIKLLNNVYVYHKMHDRKLNLHLLKIGTESREYYFKKYSCNINRFYRLLLVKYIVKFIYSFLIGDKRVIQENVAWIKLCYYKNTSFIK